MRHKRASYVYMEYLRVLCAFMVIVIHVSGQNWSKIPIGSLDWVVRTSLNVAGRLGVAVFCMISGALFLRPNKTIALHDVFHRYIKRILIDHTVASCTPLLSVPLNGALVSCVSLGVAAALRRVPLAKRVMG